MVSPSFSFNQVGQGSSPGRLTNKIRRFQRIGGAPVVSIRWSTFDPQRSAVSDGRFAGGRSRRLSRSVGAGAFLIMCRRRSPGARAPCPGDLLRRFPRRIPAVARAARRRAPGRPAHRHRRSQCDDPATLTAWSSNISKRAQRRSRVAICIASPTIDRRGASGCSSR